MSTDPSIIEQQEPPRSFWSRWAGVYFSPSETYWDIARKPNFISPLIVAIVAGLVLTEAVLFKIGAGRIIRNAIEQSAQGSQMTGEQIDQAVQKGSTIVTVIAHVNALVGTPIFLLIIAGLGLAFVNVIYGEQMNFKTSFSVACYTNLIFVVGIVMALAIIFFGDAESFNANNPMPTNPGFFLNPLETSKPLLAIASSLDLISFWFIALLGIGYSAASGGKVKAFSISALFFGCWLVVVLIKVGIALIS